MKKFIDNNRISFFIVSFCLVLIIFVSSLVVFHENIVLDTMVYEFLINNFSCNFMDEFMMSVTRLSNTTFVIIFTIIMFLIGIFVLRDKRRVPVVFLFSVGGCSFINQLLKFTVKRVRPDINKMIEIGGYSFPSGHAMVSVVLYGLLAYFSYKFIKNKIVKNIIVVINVLLVLLIGISRIYLGVHYFSDVFVGQLISLVLLVIIINYLEKKVILKN